MSEQLPNACNKANLINFEEEVTLQNLDPTKQKTMSTCPASSECCKIKAPHIANGHTFTVTTVVQTQTISTEKHLMMHQEETPKELTAVLVPKPSTVSIAAKPLDVSPSCSSDTRAMVPLSSSLPSKLLRFHAKRSAQSLLQQSAEQSQSLDSQFSSDEGATGGCSSSESNATYDIPTPTAPSMSPLPQMGSNTGEGFDDVGMGSSIEDSEESEEDDELKPLAVDNHVLHDVELNSHSPTNSPTTSDSPAGTTAELSEANLEKFHKHHHHNMDNIYLHPNFKYELDFNHSAPMESSPPPAVAPANSPTEEPKRVHRSFLTMKKSATDDFAVNKAHSSVSSLTNTDINAEQSLINEIDTLDPALIPNDELSSEITEAVEFYFSNESILKDAFLLKHVRRNKEGFVSLKLVSSFKRVRQLTKDWKVVGYAVRRKSRKIELNDVGTKVRRLEPLPNFDETMPSRTIVACDLPLDKLTIEKVSDIFSKCGEIALIRILKPGMAIPVDVRQFMNKYPEMQQKECALVEYLESSSARDAKHLQGPFQVYDMVAPKKKTGKKAVIQMVAPVARMVENYRYYNDANYERTRGGSFSGMPQQHEESLRYKLKRNNSDFHAKTLSDLHHSHGLLHQHQYQQPHHHHHHQPHHSPTHRGGLVNEHHTHTHTHQFQQYQPRSSISHDASTQAAASPSNSMNFFAYAPRRYSNASTISANTSAALGESNTTAVQTSALNNNNNGIRESVRRLSNCSDNYGGYTQDISRRTSNCSENMPQRRDSTCSDNCPCSRRVSDFGQQTEVYRKTSQGSIGSGERRFSNGSLQFERTFSNASESRDNNNGGSGFGRRMSNDFNSERKQSVETQTNLLYDHDGNVGGGGGGYNVFPRRYSNNFNASSKLAAYDNAQYINGRRISTDSGYDRRCSFGSEFEGSPRSRTGSFLSNYKHSADFDGSPRSRTGSFLDGSPRSRSGSLAQRNAENLVRTPLGPDGSKGFGSRARKFGQTVSPVN